MNEPESTQEPSQLVAQTGVRGRLGAIASIDTMAMGLVAAGAALGLSEILSGISRQIPSLVVSVADVIVDHTPGFIARWSIGALGTAQKPALVWGIVVVSLLLGVVLGLVSAKRWWIMPAGLVLFSVVGGWAAARNPLASDGLGLMSGLVSGAFGIAVFLGLYLLALASSSAVSGAEVAESDKASGVGKPGDVVDAGDASDPASVPMVGRGRFNDRRRFVGAVGIMAGVSLVGGLFGRWLRRSDTVEGAREGFAAEAIQNRTIATPTVRSTRSSTSGATTTSDATATPASEVTSNGSAEPTPTVIAELARQPNFDHIAGIASLITPNEDFYLIDTALSYPQVDPEDWSLRIHGMVNNEMEIGFEELLDLGLVREQVTLSCVSNAVGGSLVGNAEWVGVPLAKVLQQAGIQRGATQIVGRSIDRWTAGFPTEVALDGRIAMVAVQMNGEPLPISHGFPARLVVAGLYGYVSATKWLSELELTTWEGFDGYWIPRGWAKEGPIKTQSRIDVPRQGSTVAPGPTPIAGVAWAPDRAIEKVEVQVDEEPWVQADLSRETTINSWRQWMVTWDATPGEHRVRVRATDGTGITQTPEVSSPAPDGATGWHTIQVRADQA
ncbi:MAG: molybdopterin-dependent oxidoreductase [Acidimicrobiia bacterium]|nr:molybdopterin-dependent oxidoreductase [Acidimicrobiia bacterium]MYC57030.1 molybdopterin-dependent oxidoreductase [Acidimicrobiia bacterium]MYI30293.1 molybdopterin-dependent oxidoreductase [Acidimicrobiia bacterium]